MLKYIKAPVILMVITIVTTAALYYESRINDIKLDAPNATSKKELTSVNAIVDNIDLVIIDSYGDTKAQLKADRLKHFADPKLTELNHPNLTVNQPAASWVITSVNGSIQHNNNAFKQIEEIVLFNNVDITRNNIDNVNLPYIKLNTSKITYYPQKDLMSSNEPVSITTENSTTTAKGLLFNKHEQKLSLLSDVTSIYEVSSLSTASKTKK